MNNQESKDFNFVHDYNLNGIEAIKACIVLQWNKAGMPKTKEQFTAEFKHFWIWVTGLIQRLFDAIMLRGKKE